MTQRTGQNLLIIGSFLLLALIVLSPLLDRALSPRVRTVDAAATIRVWAAKGTGLYYCPDSRFYGKVKPGVYMIQQEALERGYRPAAQESCR
jgi:hypothetical protein